MNGKSASATRNPKNQKDTKLNVFFLIPRTGQPLKVCFHVPKSGLSPGHAERLAHVVPCPVLWMTEWRLREVT